MTHDTDVPPTFAAFVGLDWADATHDGCLQTADSTQRAYCQLEHTPAAINAWGTTLRTRFNGPPVAIGPELNQGPLLSALRQYDFLVLFPINPLRLVRYREAFTPSRAKDAPSDAALQLERVLTQRDKLQPLNPQRPTRRALTQLGEHRRRVVGDPVRRTNRLTSTLKHSCPHVLYWLQDKDTTIFCDCLSRWPTLTAGQLARRATLETFFRDHHVRYVEVMAERIQAIAAFDPAIAQWAQRHPDFPFFQALPGAGPVFASRLLVAFGEQRARSASAAELQKYAGIAPVTARSGKKSWVPWRRQCPKALRHTFVAWAAESIRHACWAQVDSQQQRDTGKAHQAAVRALAFTWLRILSRCWQERTPYEASVSLQALHRRGASLLHNLAKTS